MMKPGILNRGWFIGLVIVGVLQLSACKQRTTFAGKAPAFPVEKVQSIPTPTAIAPASTPAAVDCSSTGLGSDERLITLLSTNDIHGGVEAGYHKGKKQDIGGMSFWTGAIRSVREGIRQKYSDACGGALLLDGGDQFQGTLLSNFFEGELVFDLMDKAGYDAVVPGNHDYDFGPMGWLEDQVTAKTKDQDSRGALKKAITGKNFPLLSANTYERGSFFSKISGAPLSVSQAGCKSSDMIDWSRVRRPDFLSNYIVKTIAGVRVALVGLDNLQTPVMTTIENVTDLCFREPVEEFKALYPELRQKADVIVLLIHDGNSDKEFGLSKFVETLQAWNADAVDAVIGGHTHFINEVNKNGVPITQSGSGGERFGRINLIFDTKTKKVLRPKMTFNAGIALFHQICDKVGLQNFCNDTSGSLKYDSVEVKKDAVAESIIQNAKSTLAPLANRILGEAKKNIVRDRVNESPMANILTDALRSATGADMAMINAGGVRADLAQGSVNYDDFFKVVPFNNLAVILDPLDTNTLVALMKRSVATCGGYGALQSSGVRVTFSKDCSHPVNGIDPNAKLLTIRDGAGDLVYDASQPNPVLMAKNYRIATLDFLSSGGSGYSEFIGVKRVQDLGIFREILVDQLVKAPQVWNGGTDGRWSNTTP